MQISVVVPVRNGERTLPRLMASLVAQSLKPYEIIVVDDGSSDRSPDIAREYGAKLYFTGGGKGANYARNLGVKASSGDIIAFTDSDCVAHPDWLLAALLAFALLAGLGLGSAYPGGAPLFSLWPSLATVAIILISGAAAPRLGRRLWKLQRPLWALSLAFLTAWAALGWLRGGPPAPRLWAAAGTALFGGRLSAWFAGLPADGDGREHAAGFYMLSLSLMLLARLAFPPA